MQVKSVSLQIFEIFWNCKYVQSSGCLCLKYCEDCMESVSAGDQWGEHGGWVWPMRRTWWLGVTNEADTQFSSYSKPPIFHSSLLTSCLRRKMCSFFRISWVSKQKIENHLLKDFSELPWTLQSGVPDTEYCIGP